MMTRNREYFPKGHEWTKEVNNHIESLTFASLPDKLKEKFYAALEQAKSKMETTVVVRIPWSDAVKFDDATYTRIFQNMNWKVDIKEDPNNDRPCATPFKVFTLTPGLDPIRVNNPNRR